MTNVSTTLGVIIVNTSVYKPILPTEVSRQTRGESLLNLAGFKIITEVTTAELFFWKTGKDKNGLFHSFFFGGQRLQHGHRFACILQVSDRSVQPKTDVPQRRFFLRNAGVVLHNRP